MASKEKKLEKITGFVKEEAAGFSSGNIDQLETLANDESGAFQFLDTLTGSSLSWTHLLRFGIPVSDAPFKKVLVEILTDVRGLGPGVPLVTNVGVKITGKIQNNLAIEDVPGQHACFMPVSEQMLSFREAKHISDDYKNRAGWDELTTALNEDKPLCDRLHNFKWDYYNAANQTLYNLKYGGQIIQSGEDVLITCQSFMKKKGFFRIKWLFELQERLEVFRKIADYVATHAASVSEHSGNPMRSEELILDDLKSLE